jgi:3-methyl-2-oxobutanoate hydroxymethyltransferase
MSYQTNEPQVRNTLKKLGAQLQKGRKLTMLTAYDAITAALLDQSGIDLILVGDSLGNVVLGYETTLPVTLDDIIRHTQAVVRGSRLAFIVADLPFGAAHDPESALQSSLRIFKETGAQAVKIEGGAAAAPTVRRIVEQGMPVMAHIGLTPQSIHQLGGYHRHGKTDSEVRRLLDDALTLEAAGAFAVVLECIYPEVTQQISDKLTIPTIGIGSGPHCDGQVLVINDLIGLGVKPAPSFAKPRADVASLIRQATQAFITDVQSQPEPSSPKAPELHGNA